jgi:hypothetical protein
MQGGVARDGWYPLGLGKRKLLSDGVAGEATVLHFYEMDEASNVGNAQHDFKLEIRVPGREPYELQGLFRIPVKLIDFVGSGTVVPVKVHPSDPKRAVFDWEHFEPSATNDAGAAPSRESIRGQVHDAMPDATRTMMLDGWVQATKAGGLSRPEFDQTLADAVESGMVTQEEADAARAKLA